MMGWDDLIYNISTESYAVTTSSILPAGGTGLRLYSLRVSKSGDLLYLGDSSISTIVLTSRCVPCQSHIPLFAHYTSECSWRCKENFQQLDFPSEVNASDYVDVKLYGVSQQGNLSSTCVPLALPRGSEAHSSRCWLNFTWTELLTSQFVARASDWLTGGLGKLMVRDRYLTWVCQRNHTCAESEDAFYCLIFDEVQSKFVAWGSLTQLGLRY
ncbi:hypothetical protein GUITHDRAFT_104679 [Guillardia theta CCMP2712]|uniref:Uncharacterized protein n=1 Tax=Guillardia theta (strain CCMP2712) TaxID=905079 RepID=L1JNE5_GUITC|nr:hypothetical protein GUITHDRAFT_104679 [Guillardia theta CCMP2712]EKX49715.1 hypothetical protein GUITHDRAFT_104679 [Guillardia theta CCMP2712]|eukprot:XP_005836695.1 hypothetical protein GUITHDRAFT_104679 [Guillardia theta CCMP2712]